PRPTEPPEYCRLNRQKNLGDRHQLQLVATIDDHARIKREEKNREIARRCNQSDDEGAVRELECEPSLTNLLHPCSDQRDGLADPEKPEVPVHLEHPEWIQRSRAIRHYVGLYTTPAPTVL